MFGRPPQLYERKCDACGTTWLLTKQQAKYRPRSFIKMPGSASSPMQTARGFGAPDAMDLSLASASASGYQSQLTGDVSILDALRACPKCQLQNFTQRKVTAEEPASPNAYRGGLP